MILTTFYFKVTTSGATTYESISSATEFQSPTIYRLGAEKLDSVSAASFLEINESDGSLTRGFGITGKITHVDYSISVRMLEDSKSWINIYSCIWGYEVYTTCQPVCCILLHNLNQCVLEPVRLR